MDLSGVPVRTLILYFGLSLPSSYCLVYQSVTCTIFPCNAYTFTDILSAFYRNFWGDLRHVNVRVWVFCYDDSCTELSHSSMQHCTVEPWRGSALYSFGSSIVLVLPYRLIATRHLWYSWPCLWYSWVYDWMKTGYLEGRIDTARRRGGAVLIFSQDPNSRLDKPNLA